MDQGVVNTPIGICNVEPGYCQKAFTSLDDVWQLHLMLCDSGDGGEKSFLQVRIEILVGTLAISTSGFLRATC